MTLLVGRIVTGLMALGMLFVSPFPLYLASFYLICKPLLAPVSHQQYALLGKIPLTSVPAILLIVFGFSYSFFKKGFTLFPRNVVLLYALLYFSLLSFINTTNYVTSLHHITKFLTAIAMYLLVYNSIKSADQARLILYAFVIGSIIPMLVGYHQYITETGYVQQRAAGTRIASVLVEHNIYGQFLCLVLVSTIMLILQERNRLVRRCLVVLMSSMVVSLILSLNRASWAALTFALLAGSILYRQKIRLGWVLLPVVLTWVLFSPIIVQRFTEAHEKASKESYGPFGYRMVTWQRITPLIGKHPLVGFGIGTSRTVTEKSFGTDAAPHNDYLRLALEAGIPCSLLYLVFLLRELTFNVKRRFDERNWFINYPMLVATIYFCIMSMVQNIVYNVTIFPMMLGLIGLSHKYNILEGQDRTE